jgi:prophage maintenance system killer protein
MTKRFFLLAVLLLGASPDALARFTLANPCGYYFAEIWRPLGRGDDALRSVEAIGGFAYPVTANEIEIINRQMGGTTLLTGHLDSVLAGAERETSFFRKSAVIIRGIAGNHMFDNGNKRTAQAVYELLKSRNGVVNGVKPEVVRRVIDHIGRGELKEIDEIASALRGY